MTRAPLAIALREVRHLEPDSWLHVEPLPVRGELHDGTIPARHHEGLHEFQWLEQGRAELLPDGVPHLPAAPAALMVAPGCVHALRFERGSAGGPEGAAHPPSIG